MDIHHLKAFVAAHDNFEIRVITHSGSRFYQVEVEDLEGKHELLTRAGKPMLFRALDDVYLELKRAGIHRAYLVQHVPQDEVIGRQAHYHDPLTSRIPLAF
ncbi:DUF6482 family protein [Halomonas pacifica]|uniref:Uncharacterized protein n=1 Tax=Bisbaumannia pacifica TaxID=77098 RepID=A0A510X371_9GAMM|nr:DUF6482 family protein [Halomonas pacifica]MBH8579265.1 hypothetical protein [Halomonas pacifica]MDC8803045.1 DUF6482 family protein [Halomonas pacifica]GEK45859.1 hypothetical protein HPA02_01420 [Halomonas pacifica]